MAKSKGESIRERLNESLKFFDESSKNTEKIKNTQERLDALQQTYADRQRLINDLQANFRFLQTEQKDKLDELIVGQNQHLGTIRELNKELRETNKQQDSLNKKVQRWGDNLGIVWQYLMSSDKVIKETIKNLGLSGAKAEAMRTSFELSSKTIARMGGNMADIQNIMQGYADETGRARVLSAQMVEDIGAVGLGTGLGIENAARLGAQFELMGFDARKTVDYVQGIVDTSERMGVNTTKVLKNINENFKKVNTYSFKTGSQGIAQMAMYGEKFKVSMTNALNAADAAKSLENAIGLAANLQVMGGEFAKTDPLEWMYLARNEPDKLTKKISEMTRGMVTFRKNSEGTFEKFISPADRQRLESVAKSLGMTAEEITEITQRRAELDLMSRQLAGTGLTNREKELVEGAAVFNAKSAKFEVQLAGRMRDISTLTAEQAKSFAKEQVSLQKRAEAAMDFETAFKATIEEFKTILLPMLKGINGVLNFIRPIAQGINDALSWLAKNDIGRVILQGAGMLMAAGFVLNKAFLLLSSRGLGERLGGLFSGGGKTTGGGNVKGGGITRDAKGRFVGSKNAGKGMMRGGAGVGAAAVGVGAGIGLAATGISLLADSMSKLDDKQAETLKSIVTTLGIFIGVGVAAAAAIAIFGVASKAASIGLLLFGAAVLMVGGGIAIAALGIGQMAKGLSEMFTALQGVSNMGEITAGMAGLIAVLGASTITLPAAIGLGFAISRIGKNADNLVKVGAAMREINAALTGSKEDYIAVQNAIESISGMNRKSRNALSDLATLLKNPLKVEFADKTVSLVNDITLQIDGKKFMQEIYRPSLALQSAVDTRGGKRGEKI